MTSSALIKRTAKDCLKGHWGQAVAAFSVLFCVFVLRGAIEEVVRMITNIQTDLTTLTNGSQIITFFPDSLRFINWYSFLITVLFLILGIFILAPVSLGATRFFWRLSGGENESVGVIFDFFSSRALYARAVWLSFQIAGRMLLFALVLNLPTVGLLLVSNSEISSLMGFVINPVISSTLRVLAGALFVVSLFALVSLYLRYFLAGYFVAQDDEIEVEQAIDLSVSWMHGYKSKCFSLGFSFVPWLLLSVFAFPLIYVVPYISQTFACFARNIFFERYHTVKPAE